MIIARLGPAGDGRVHPVAFACNDLQSRSVIDEKRDEGGAIYVCSHILAVEFLIGRDNVIACILGKYVETEIVIETCGKIRFIEIEIPAELTGVLVK